MKKPIIAIDIDDVLANSTDALRREVNTRLGVALQPEHYNVPGEYRDYYVRVWETQGIGGRITMDDLDPQMRADQSHVQPHADAAWVLKQLAKSFELVVVTSRNEPWRPATETWLGRNFPDTFSRLLFAGQQRPDAPKTKGEVCVEIGAGWLIDDIVGHCQTALDAGVTAVLFGSYGWQQNVPSGITRCKDWNAVLEYFDGRDS